MFARPVSIAKLHGVGPVEDRPADAPPRGLRMVLEDRESSGCWESLVEGGCGCGDREEVLAWGRGVLVGDDAGEWAIWPGVRSLSAERVGEGEPMRAGTPDILFGPPLREGGLAQGNASMIECCGISLEQALASAQRTMEDPGAFGFSGVDCLVSAVFDAAGACHWEARCYISSWREPLDNIGSFAIFGGVGLVVFPIPCDEGGGGGAGGGGSTEDDGKCSLMEILFATEGDRCWWPGGLNIDDGTGSEWDAENAESPN